MNRKKSTNFNFYTQLSLLAFLSTYFYLCVPLLIFSIHNNGKNLIIHFVSIPTHCSTTCMIIACTLQPSVLFCVCLWHLCMRVYFYLHLGVNYIKCLLIYRHRKCRTIALSTHWLSKRFCLFWLSIWPIGTIAFGLCSTDMNQIYWFTLYKTCNHIRLVLCVTWCY